jgi:hypothetical protein
VRSISAAWILRWRLPQPNITRLPSVRRRNGILRATAACTIEPVLGPRRTSSSSSRNWCSAPARSNGASSSAARHSCCASSSARRPTASSEYSTTTWKMPCSSVGALAAARLQRSHMREARAQPRFEAGDAVDIQFAGQAGDDRFDRRVVAPQIRATQGPDARYFHKPLILFRWLSRRRARWPALAWWARPSKTGRAQRCFTLVSTWFQLN